MNRALLFLLLCAVALGASFYLSGSHKEIAIGSFSLALPPQVEEVKQVEKTKIQFVGDIMLARNVENIMRKYGVSYPFELLPSLPEDAFLVGNFESSVPKVHVPTQSMQFSFSVLPENVQGLFEYGFTHLSLANNHSFDFGKDDYENTKEVLGALFEPFGHQETLNEDSVTVIDIGTSTVALIGVYAVDAQPTQAEIEAVLAYAQEQSSYQVAYVHWGTEYAPSHNASQERLARQLIDGGVDAVIGHHPHVVQDIEKYNDTLIFYSLGNFIFDQYFSDDVQQGLMLELSEVENRLAFKLIPVTSIGSRSQARLASTYERDVLLEDIADKSDESLKEGILLGYIE